MGIPTDSIAFDTDNLTGTAANIQAALLASGYTGTTVGYVGTAEQGTGSSPSYAYTFQVTFAGLSRYLQPAVPLLLNPAAPGTGQPVTIQVQSLTGASRRASCPRAGDRHGGHRRRPSW